MAEVLLLTLRFLTEGSFEANFEDWIWQLSLQEAKERLDGLGELVVDAFLLVSCGARVHKACSPVFKALKGRYRKQHDGFLDALASRSPYSIYERERLVIALAMVELRVTPFDPDFVEEVVALSWHPRIQRDANEIIEENERGHRGFAEGLRAIRRAEGTLREIREKTLEEWSRVMDALDDPLDPPILPKALEVYASVDSPSRRLFFNIFTFP